MAFWSENWKYANSNTNGNNATPSSDVMSSNDPWNCKFSFFEKNALFTIEYNIILPNI